MSESKVLLNLMPTAIKSDRIDLSSEKETEELAGTFLKKIKPGCFIFLYGEIGVGKTTFIRYLINHCLLYTSPSPRDKRQSRMPSSA